MLQNLSAKGLIILEKAEIITAKVVIGTYTIASLPHSGYIINSIGLVINNHKKYPTTEITAPMTKIIAIFLILMFFI